MTFPEYVTPHARDLLRRILVPDPRKRADLFEVARHSWLSDYQHVVAHFTSSTTNVAGTAQTAAPAGKFDRTTSRSQALTWNLEDESPGLNRSASVREGPSKAAATSPGSLTRAQEGLVQDVDESSTGSRRERVTRHTLQPEYVAPQTHTARGKGPAASSPSANRYRTEGADQAVAAAPAPALSKPLPQEPPRDSPRQKPQSSAHASMQAPTRPARDIPRSVSDSTSAFGNAPFATSGGQYTTRPSTQGSLTSATGPTNTRSDLRLPSRGSYGQPVAPTVATTNVQGRVTQPTKSARAYNISGPLPSPGAQNSIGQPMTTPMPPPTAHQPQKNNHHRRSSTLSGLGERLFGRSNSVAKKDTDRQKNGRKYPPTSMKEYAPESGPRMSTDSKRSFSFGIGKKRSSDMSSHGQTEKPVRRFSLIPNSVSFKSLMGGSKEETYKSPNPQGASRPPTGDDYVGQSVSNNDGSYEGTRHANYNSFSRSPQPQYQEARPTAPSSTDDVYGGTGVYTPHGQGRGAHQRQQSEPMAQMMAKHSDGADNVGRPSVQQGRQARVLVKNNRKFADAFDHEQGPAHHAGRSGAVKRVQDFFRRRRAPTDGGDYR